MNARILIGDVRERLRELPDESVQCVVTSPPYWGLRDYHADGQIGLEASVEEHLETMVAVFREVRRVLRVDGTVWANYGDLFFSGEAKKAFGDQGEKWVSQGAHGTSGKRAAGLRGLGLKPKDLVGMAWRFAFALQADGWWLRSDIVWHKPNPMPESVTDRPTKSHEYVFLLTRSPRYFYDADAVREPPTRPELVESKRNVGFIGDLNGMKRPEGLQGGHYCNPAGRNFRSVWTIPTHAYSAAHFATFPPRLVEPCVKAGSREGDTVLDPFAGSGTTGVVALRLGRRFVGVELNPEYARLAEKRIREDMPLFNKVEVS